MKRNIVISILIVCAVFAFGFRDRYGPAFWRAITGGIKYTGGDVEIEGDFKSEVAGSSSKILLYTSSGSANKYNWALATNYHLNGCELLRSSTEGGAATKAAMAWTNNGTVSNGTDIYIVTKTVIKTFDVNATDASDDYQFDNTAGNTTEQTIEIASIIPAYAEILSAQVRCFETVVSSGTDVMAIDVGTSDGGAEILATADTDTANDINATAAAAGPEVVATNAARSVWVNATPDENWSTITEGRWAVMVTYIDYGATYTAKSP